MKDTLSLEPIIVADWIFKVSQLEGKLMIVAFNPIFSWSHIRFFDADHEANNWANYLIMQTESLKKESGVV